MYTYYISVGSNMGDKRGYIEDAFQQFKDHKAIVDTQMSNLIETEPWGYTEQDSFINGMWVCKSALTPHEMLGVLQELEQNAGRTREVHWGPRTLDLDIILVYRDSQQLVSIVDSILQVPHPYFWDRSFVLIPLQNLCPTFIYRGISIQDRLQELEQA